jgi:NarL family two-component system sensor histidine kinase YdfH
MPAFIPWQLAPLTAIMLLFGALLWICLAGRISRNWYWLYFLVQGILVLAAGVYTHQTVLMFNLCLALTLGATGMFRTAWPVLAVAAGYLVIFLLGGTAQMSWRSGSPEILMRLENWRSFGDTLDYANLMLFVVGYLVVHLQQVRAHAELEAAHAQLQASTMRIEELTLLTERQRLARELHDTLAQGVAGVIMRLEAANAHLSGQRIALAQDVVQQTMASARATLSEARGVIDDLRTVTSCEELADRVHEEIRRFRSATGIPCHTDLRGLDRVSPALYESVFHTIREGLTNVALHARAHQVWVSVTPAAEDEGTLATIVRDDGIGFDPATVTGSAGHYGLLGLRERARIAGGALDVMGVPGAGAVLQLRIPAEDGALVL